MDTYGASSGGAIRRASLPAGGSSANWASDAERYGIGLTQDAPSLLVPSYLRDSRYMSLFRKARAAHIAELQEHANRSSYGRHSSYSASSGSVNIPKAPGAAYSHRTMVSDVVERSLQYMMDDNFHPLPTRLNEQDKAGGLEIFGDGSEVKFNGTIKGAEEAASVRADYPMPKECGIYYFEITILSRSKEPSLIGIGFSSPKVDLNRLPGWETDSWAYHGDDGHAFECHATGKQYGPKFAKEDVVGCGVNFRTKTAFFTKNGIYLGTAFSGIKDTHSLYPSVGMKKQGEHLQVNFGQSPFVFDIDKMVQQEKKTALREIQKVDTTPLQPSTVDSMLHHIVSQYLAHDGYVETAKAFARDVNEAEGSLHDKQTFSASSDEDDIHAVQRQRIRKSILDGDIDRALKYTNSYYPHVLQDEQNHDINFRLRCRKFIEMMKRHLELGDTTSSPITATRSRGSFDSLGGMERPKREEKSSDRGSDNGVEKQANDDLDDDGHHESDESQDVQMEVDDQFHRETSFGHDPLSTDIDMDASQELASSITKLKAPDLLAAAIVYGQELQQEFGNDAKLANRKYLSDIFSIMAYRSISESPVAHLFDLQGRNQIAEEVNGAILVSLGKASDAALEVLCNQTEQLLDCVAKKTGGAAAFVSVNNDFLRP